MFFIKLFKKKIPSFRHKKDITVKDNLFFFKKKTKKKNIYLIKRRRFFYNSFPTLINSTLFKYSSLIIKQPNYQFKPFKKFFICSSLDNFSFFIPGIEFLNVGKVILHYNFFKDYKNKVFFKGFLTYISIIPITSIFCNVTDLSCKKITYSKAGGTFCKTRKTKKTKKKLILIVLPSKKEIFLTKFCKAYLGKNTNFRLNKLVEGKWGFSFHKKKKLSVRGVAMNPVDHPNGGRAKTVQPERSPWNWVAKKKK